MRGTPLSHVDPLGYIEAVRQVWHMARAAWDDCPP